MWQSKSPAAKAFSARTRDFRRPGRQHGALLALTEWASAVKQPVGASYQGMALAMPIRIRARLQSCRTEQGKWPASAAVVWQRAATPWLSRRNGLFKNCSNHPDADATLRVLRLRMTFLKKVFCKSCKEGLLSVLAGEMSPAPTCTSPPRTTARFFYKIFSTDFQFCVCCDCNASREKAQGGSHRNWPAPLPAVARSPSPRPPRR